MAESGKLSRVQLKAIVKECLIEILQEGLGGLPLQPIYPTVKPQVTESRVATQQRPQQQKRVSPLDIPIGNKPQPNQALLNAIKAESRGNKVMADIFADTAMTTLPKMLSGGDTGNLSEGSRPAHSISQNEQFNGTPEQVFGEDITSKWANLAFADASPKK